MFQDCQTEMKSFATFLILPTAATKLSEFEKFEVIGVFFPTTTAKLSIFE